jgi:hypothetical protein
MDKPSFVKPKRSKLRWSAVVLCCVVALVVLLMNLRLRVASSIIQTRSGSHYAIKDRKVIHGRGWQALGLWYYANSADGGDEEIAATDLLAWLEESGHTKGFEIVFIIAELPARRTMLERTEQINIGFRRGSNGLWQKIERRK